MKVWVRSDAICMGVLVLKVPKRRKERSKKTPWGIRVLTSREKGKPFR